MRIIISFLICLLFFTSCQKLQTVSEEEHEVCEILPEIDHLRIRAEEITASLEDKHLISQVFLTAIPGNARLLPNIRILLKEIPCGGIILFRRNMDASNDSIRSFISDTVSVIKEESGIPPFFAIDHEGGTVNRFNQGVATLPSAHTYYQRVPEEGRFPVLADIKANSFNAGQEMKALGFSMNLAPIAEYLMDDNRRFLMYRSFSADPVFTAQAALSFMQGMEQAGILCVVKHFPGSAGPDPHYSASVLNYDKPALDTLVWPFSVLINNGARAIMAAHTAAPVVDSKIASLSSLVMQDWLRDELGFDGLIVSDDFVMAAAGSRNPELSAIQSIEAGANMIIVWSQDLEKTRNAFMAALENGTLSREKLNDAVQRIIYEKLRWGVMSNEQ